MKKANRSPSVVPLEMLVISLLAEAIERKAGAKMTFSMVPFRRPNLSKPGRK